MKKFSTLLIVLFLIFGIVQTFAQKKAKPREVIMIEISVPNFEEADKREVLMNRPSKIKYDASGSGGQSCINCNEPSDSFYGLRAGAVRIGKDSAKVGFKIEIDEKCKTRKVFMVYRNQQTKIQLNCGVSLVAYYGYESEEAN